MLLPSMLAAFAPMLALPIQEELNHFDAAQVFLGPRGTKIMGTLDFDGDGFLDGLGMGVSSSPDKTSFRFHRNRGDGSFDYMPWVKEVQYGQARFDNPLAIGDIDGDGMDDFALAVSDRLYPFLSRKSGNPDQLPHVQLGDYFNNDLEIADVNGDGLGDMVALADEAFVVVTSAARPVRGNAVRHLSPGRAVRWTPGMTNSISLPDKQVQLSLYRGADGLWDVATHREGEVQLIPIENGVPTLGPTFSLGWPYAYSGDLAAGDVDADGDDDLVVFYGANYEVLRQDPSGTFVLEPWVSGGGPATHLMDVNGDGAVDGVCCGGGGGGSYHTNPSKWEIAINDGTGNFAPSFQIPGLAGERWAGAGDLDGDGDLDLIAGRAAYFSRGGLEGKFEAQGLANLIDLDGDGDLDSGLTIRSPYGPPFESMINDGSGNALLTSLPSFNLPAGYSLPHHDEGLGDWDGDGDPDLLVSWTSGMSTTHLFKNVAGTMHGDLLVFPDGPSPFDALQTQRIALDIDRDGDLDLIRSRTSAVTPATNNCSVYWNDGSGGFTVGGSLMDQVYLSTADIDGDGIEDVLAGDIGSIGWRRLLPGGGLGPYVPFPMANMPEEALGHGDLDGDQDVDIVTTVDGDTPLLLLNDGAGSFTAQLGFLPAVSFVDNKVTAVGFLVVDVDADGDEDLIMTPYPSASNSHQVWVNDGFLNFTPSPPQVVTGSVTYFGYGGASGQEWDTVSGDIDLDGDLDLLGETWWENLAVRDDEAGSNQQYGTGVAGTGGIVPKLGVSGSTDVGGTVEITVAGAVGSGTLAGFLIGSAPDYLVDYPVAGHTGLVALAGSTVLYVPTGGVAGAGEGTCIYSFPIPVGVAGTTFYYQAFICDPQGPGSLSATNGLRVTYGLP